MSIYGIMDGYHGDEPEIEEEERERSEEYDDEHAEDYKYTDEWLGI